MRLTPQQQATLVDAVRRHFGATARLWVFGSRADDRARGGDFDVMVRCDEADAVRLIDARLALLAELHATFDFEDERIDLLLFSPSLHRPPSPIQQAAMAQGVELPF